MASSSDRPNGLIVQEGGIDRRLGHELLDGIARGPVEPFADLDDVIQADESRDDRRPEHVGDAGIPDEIDAPDDLLEGRSPTS